MAVQNEIIKLLLQFETAFTSKDEFSTFVNGTIGKLGDLDKKLEGSGDNLKNYLQKFQGINKASNAELAQLFDLFKKLPETNVLQNNAKIIKESINLIDQALLKKLDVSNLQDSLSKIQQAFIPKSNKSSEFAQTFLSNLEKQFQAFGSGSLNLNQFFENLFPKEITATTATAKIKTELAKLKETVENNIKDLENLTPKKRFEILQKIADTILADTTKVSVASTSVKATTQELTTAISTMVRSFAAIAFKPPADFFAPYFQALKLSAKKEGEILREILSNLIASFNTNNIQLQKGNQVFSILESLGFSKATIEKEFDSLNTFALRKFEEFNKNINTAAQSKTLDIRSPITDFQKFMSDAFTKNSLSGFSEEFQKQFEKVKNELQGFSSVKSQTLSDFQAFKTGVTELNAALDSGKGAGTPTALALKELLNTYLQFEGAFRFKEVLNAQGSALTSFGERVTELQKNLRNGIGVPKEFVPQFLTSPQAGEAAILSRDAAMKLYDETVSSVTRKIAELNNAIKSLESTKSQASTVEQQTALEALIKSYKDYNQSLNQEIVALNASREAWNANWINKLKDVDFAKEKINAFLAALNKPVDGSNITSYLGSIIKIGLESAEAKNVLEGSFQKFGGITKEALQNVELFQRALTTLFASTGTGAEKVTLIDLNSLKTQADGTTVATGHLQEQLLKLAGTSTAAREQFDLLSFAVNFLKQVGGDTSIFGEQLNSLHKLAQGTRSYLSVIELLEIRLESYRGTLAKIESSQNAVNIRLATANAAKGDDRALAIQDLSAAYKELSRDLIKAEDQLKKLKETEQGLKEKKAQFGIEDGGQFTLLQTSIANAEKEVNKLKEALNTLKTTDKSGILKSVIEDIDKGNEQIQNSLTKLKEQAAKKLAGVLETIRNQLARTTLGKQLADSVTQQIDALSSALNSVNLSGALAAITALQSEIQKTFTDKTNSSAAMKELAETYLKPYQELLKGVESIAVKLATALPTLSLATTEKTKIGTELDAIRIKIQETNAVLATFGSTANTAQLTTRFKEVQDKVIALKTELQGLNAGTIDSAKIGEIQTRFSDVRKELIDLNKEARALNLKDAVSPLAAEINTIKESLKELGKGSRLEGLQSQFDKLKTTIPPVIANIDGLKKLLQDSFAGNKELVNTASFVKLKNDLQAIERTITDTEQKAPYTRLIAQVQDAIEKTERYNAVVKAGSSRDVGIQAVITPESYTKTVQVLKDLDAELIQNRTSLSQFLISSNQTAEGAKQLATSFAITRESFRDLKQVAGELSGTSSNLDKHIRDLLRAGEDVSIIKVFKDIKTEIDSAIKTKESLNKAFQGGFTKDLETDLNRLVTAKTLMEQFRAVGDSFKSAAFFDSTSYSARQAFEQIQRLESAMRTAKNNIDQSLSVGRRDTIDAGVSSQLSVQRADLDANIIKLKELGQVYDQLRSKPKIEIFEQLKNTFENITGNGRTQLQAYKTEFETTVSGVTASIASLKGGVAPLTQTLVDSFKQQSESITATSKQYEEFLKILRSMGAAGYTKFQFADGSEIGIGRLIVTLKNLLEQANAVKAPIEQTSNELKDKLGTAAGQAELRISNLITKFTQLQDRINTLNPGSSINEIYGSVKELMMLLNQPYKTGPFFTLPKEGFAPIRNELLGLLEIAKTVAHGLQTNLTLITPGTTKYKDTELQIKAAREEVERLTAASQRLSEFEKNASHFSALRGNLHGASTTLQELAHEGAFIYKGLEALFKNLAKNLTGPVVTINTATLNQQLDQLTTKFGVTGTAADHLKTQVKEALNQQLGGGGLAAAEQYQKAFQQLEEAFVKFRSGLTQAAMGFQMLGDSLLEPFKKAKEHFEEFSDIMGVVRAVTNATQVQFDALTNKALVMGATTRFTAQQAAEGLKQLAKAGFTAEQQLGALPSVMRLAQAAGTELATAATVATVVMQEFRMDPEQFTEAADKIALAANRTLGTVEDLGFAFKYVGALASNIGADFGDLTAAIALLHNAGLKGTLAGTALRGMLMNLYNPTKEDEKIINQLSERIGGLGLQIQDANGNFLGFSSILKQLEQAGITSAEVLKLFGQRAGPGMAALLAQGSDALIKLEKDLKNAEGTTAHMAQIMEETLKGRLLLMRSAFEALSDSIGHTLAPTLAAAADAMADFVSRFVAVRLEFPTLTTVLDHALAGFALFASVLGGLAVTFAFIIVPVRQFMGFLKTLIITTLAGAASITSLSAAQAFNVKVTAATITAAEAEFAARVAQAEAIGADTTATGLNTIAKGINVTAIRSQVAALQGANAIIAANVAAQTSLWVGVKNIFLGLGTNLLKIGKLFAWAFTSPMGLAFTALTSIVAYTLLHEKSVSQANEELKKQGELLTYSQKEAANLSATLVNTAERIRKTQEQLKNLSNRKTDQSGLSLEKESQVTQLKIELDFDKQKLNEQLRELYTRLSEDTSKLKDKVSFEVALDDKGTFTTFKVNVDGATESIDVFANGIEGAAQQLKKLAPELDRVAQAEKDLIAQQQLGNILRKNLGESAPQDQTDFGRNVDNVLADIELLIGIGPRAIEAEKSIARAERLIKYFEQVQKKVANLSPTQRATSRFGSLENILRQLEEQRQALTAAILERNDILTESADATFNYIVESTGLSAEKVARLPNLADIIKEKTTKNFKEEKVPFTYFDDVVLRLTKQFKDIENATTVKEITSESFKKPFNEIVSALVNFESALEEKNKALKKLIKEQGDTFKDVKPLVDALKKYEDAFVKFDKTKLDQKTKTLEFDIKVDSNKILSDLSQQIEQVSASGKVVDLPFLIKPDVVATGSSLLRSIESVSGIVLSYEKSVNEELINLKIQQAKQEYETVVNTEKGKQQAIRESLDAITNFYKNKNAEYYQLEQEKNTALLDSLKTEYEATVTHLNKLYTLRVGLVQKSLQLDNDFTNRQATAASNLQKLYLSDKTDSEKNRFLITQIKALKELADEATSSDNLDRAKALLDQQQQLITQAIGEVASNKDASFLDKYFLERFQKQNLEDTGNVIDGLKSQSESAQSILTTQIELNKNKIEELSAKSKELGVSLTDALKALETKTELDIGINKESYAELQNFAEIYKKMIRDLSDFDIQVGTDIAKKGDLQKTVEDSTKAKSDQLAVETRLNTIQKAREDIKPVLSTQGVSNALSDITLQVTQLYELLNNTPEELGTEGLATYEKGVQAIQQRVAGLNEILKDSKLDPTLRAQIEDLITEFNKLSTGEPLSKAVAKDATGFVTQSRALFKTLEAGSKESGDAVAKILRESYIGAMTDVVPVLRKLLSEAMAAGDVSAFRDVSKLVQEVINQTITKIEELQKLKNKGGLTEADLTAPNQLLQILKDIKTETDAVNTTTLEVKTTGTSTIPQSESIESFKNQEAVNKKLEEQKQTQQGIIKENENTATAVTNVTSSTSTAIEQTNELKNTVIGVNKESNILKDTWVAFITTIAGVIPSAQAATTEVSKLKDSVQDSTKPESTGLLSIFGAIKQSAKDTYASVTNETTAFFDKLSNTKINSSQLIGFFTKSTDTINAFTDQVENIDLATPLEEQINSVLQTSERLATGLSNISLGSFVTDTTTIFDQFTNTVNDSANNLNVSDAFGREVDLTLQSLDKLKTNFGTSLFGNFIDDTASTFSIFSNLVNTEIENIDFSSALGREMTQAVDAVDQGSTNIVQALKSSTVYADWLKPFAENTQTTLSNLNTIASSEIDKFVKNFDLSQTSEIKGFANFIDFTKQKANELVDTFGNTTEVQTFFKIFDLAVEKSSNTLNVLGKAGKQQGQELSNAFKQSLFMYNMWKNEVEKPVKVDNTVFTFLQNAETQVKDAQTAAVDFLQTLPKLQKQSERVTVFGTLVTKVKGVLEETKTAFSNALAFMRTKADETKLPLNVEINKEEAVAEATVTAATINQTIQDKLTSYNLKIKIISNSEQLVDAALLQGLNTLSEYTTKPQLIDVRYVYRDEDRILELTKKIKELRSQQPQGFFKEPLVDSAELQQLEKALLKEYSKPVLLDVTNAKKQSTDLKNEFAKPITLDANLKLKKAESDLNALLTKKKELEINPEVNATELTKLNEQIKTLEAKVIKLRIEKPEWSMISPLGAESIIKSGEISNALTTALNEMKQFKKEKDNIWTSTETKQGVNIKVDTVELSEDLKDAEDKIGTWRKKVQRLTATGLDINGKPLEFPIPNFRADASTYEEFVSEGNRYMRFKGQLTLDPNSVKQIEDVKPIITPVVKPTLDTNAVSAEVVNTELNSIKSSSDTLNTTLKDVRENLSSVSTTPGLDAPATTFDELNNVLTNTRLRLRDAFDKGNLDTASLDEFKKYIQSLLDQMSKVEGVTPDMVKALREAADVELKDYTLKVKPEVQPLEGQSLEPYTLQTVIETPKTPEPTQPVVYESKAETPKTPEPTQPVVYESKAETPKTPEVPPLPPVDQTINPVVQTVPQVPPQTMIVNPALQPVPALPLMFVDVTPKLVSELPELTPVDVYVNPKLQEIKKPSNIEVDVDPKLQPIQKPANIEVDVDPKLQKIEAPETTVLLTPEENWAAEITQPKATVILSPESGWDEKITPPEKTVTLSPEEGWESKITPPTVTATLQPEWNISEIPQPSIVATVTALVDQAVSGIGQVMSMLDQVSQPRNVTINVHTRYTSSGSPPTQSANKGGLIGNLQYFADGGLAKFKEMAAAFVPGIGNTDTVPAMLTPGEFVIKKERVKSLGIGFLNALNSGLLQFKSAGGMIYNSPINTLNKMSDYVKPNYQIPQQAQSAGGPPIDINLTIKDKTFSIKTPRDEAKKLVSALQYLERGITKK